MIYTETLRLGFVASALAVIILLITACLLMYKKKYDLKFYVINPMIVGILTIIVYCVFLLVKDSKNAMLFESFFFVGTDWLAFFMMLFGINYTDQKNSYTKNLKTGFAILCSIDSIMLILNNVYHHMFELILIPGRSGLIEYWGNHFYFLHYLHLALCYGMVCITYFCLFSEFLKTSPVYKEKYLAILIAYFILILANFFSYTYNLPIDISVPLYGLLAGFITYHTVIAFPHKLLESTLKTVNDTISDAVLYYDIKGVCIYSNKKAQEIFIKNDKFDIEQAERYRRRWERQIRPDSLKLINTDSFIVDNKEYFFDVIYQHEVYKNVVIGFSIKLVDNTEQVVSYKKERYAAIHDSLTGIYNRIGFFEAVDKCIAENGSDDWMLLSSNIRDFKLINEYFGEQRGDDVLKRQAEICKTNSHPETIFGRINDDKLALFTRKDYFNEEEFMQFISKMAELTVSPFYKMIVQIGVYEPHGRLESAQVMYDKALMAAESSYSEYDKIFTYYDSSLMDKIVSDKRISDTIESAVSSKQIEMYLQPIVDRNEKCIGCEALSRWNHPLLGILMPSQFVGILEKSGQIFMLDEYIWECAAQVLKKWNDEGKGDYFISVNISIKDFFYMDIHKKLLSLVSKYDIDPKNLRVEITESVLMSDFAKAYTLAQKLRNSGFFVSIDNFGDGFSSLNMLKDFKASGLKIDMNFVENVAEDERGQSILTVITEMSNSLGMLSVGSGVETKELFEVLKACNCDMFQGNYFSEPIQVYDFEKKYLGLNKEE